VTIDTLAYVKALEAAGVDRPVAEAQAVALVQHVLPDLATKADLDRAVTRLEERLDQAVRRLEERIDLAVQRFEERLDQAAQRLEQRGDLALERSEHRLTVRTFGMVLGVVGLMDSILFALLRIVK